MGHHTNKAVKDIESNSVIGSESNDENRTEEFKGSNLDDASDEGSDDDQSCVENNVSSREESTFVAPGITM